MTINKEAEYKIMTQLPTIQCTFDEHTILMLTDYKHNEGINLYKELLRGDAHLSIGVNAIYLFRDNNSQILLLDTKEGEVREIL